MKGFRFSKYKKNKYRRKKKNFRKSGFAKKVSRVIQKTAEKKMCMAYNQPLFLLKNSAAAANSDAFDYLLNAFPAPGATQNQRIGTSIYIRYITLRITVKNVDIANYFNGKFYYMELHEKHNGSSAGLAVGNLFLVDNPGAAPAGPDVFTQVNYQLLKANYSKMYIKPYQLGNCFQVNPNPPGPGLHEDPWVGTINIRRKFRIMRKCQMKSNGMYDGIPRVFSFFVFQPANTGGNEIVGNGPVITSVISVSYTDI